MNRDFNSFFFLTSFQCRTYFRFVLLAEQFFVHIVKHIRYTCATHTGWSIMMYHSVCLSVKHDDLVMIVDVCNVHVDV